MYDFLTGKSPIGLNVPKNLDLRVQETNTMQIAKYFINR